MDHKQYTMLMSHEQRIAAYESRIAELEQAVLLIAAVRRGRPSEEDRIRLAAALAAIEQERAE